MPMKQLLVHREGYDGTAAAGGGEQGAFIRSAPHSVTGDNPLQTDVDILFRNMKIQIADSEPFYP